MLLIRACILHILVFQNVFEVSYYGYFCLYMVHFCFIYIFIEQKRRKHFLTNCVFSLSISFQYASKTFVPALFGHAIGDAFIPPHHSDVIHREYAVCLLIAFLDRIALYPNFMNLYFCKVSDNHTFGRVTKI